jgi:hypothetical protein
MPELTRELFVDLWRMTKAQRQVDDADLRGMQKFMAMHEDMHAYFERIEADPSTPLEVEGENLMLHIAMDAATEKALEADEPLGIRSLMEVMLASNVDPGRAFHVISQAMMHSFVIAASEGREMDQFEFMARVQQYSAQVRMEGMPGNA